MKKFLSFLGALAAIFSTVIGALVVFDKFNNKDRGGNGYLRCNMPETDEE